MKNANKENVSDDIKKVTIRNIVILMEKIIFLIVIVFVVSKYFFEFARIDNNGMEPYLNDGDIALVYKKNKSYSVGDVVTFKLDNKRYVLRIAAKEGQTISVSDTGLLLIDGWPEENENGQKTYVDESTFDKYPYRIAQGQVFLLNDNRYEDNDSRAFGTIDVKSITGKITSLVRTRNI